MCLCVFLLKTADKGWEKKERQIEIDFSKRKSYFDQREKTEGRQTRTPISCADKKAQKLVRGDGTSEVVRGTKTTTLTLTGLTEPTTERQRQRERAKVMS